jgi:4-carboxymuconolactone decarboxylase
MSDEPTARRNPYSDIAPALGDYTDNVLFGDVWERPGLSKRDRSLITVATLVALYRRVRLCKSPPSMGKLPALALFYEL